MRGIVKGLLVFGLIILTGAFLLKIYLDKNSMEKMVPSSLKALELIEKNGMPEFKGTSIDGAEFDINSLRGKAVVIGFWASWCAPCVEEFPSMIKMLDQFGGEVVLVAISADSDKDDVFEFYENFKIKSPHLITLHDPKLEIAGLFGTEKIPENFLFRKNFSLVRKFSTTEDWASDPMIAIVKSALQ